jgi:hypothetical protein
MGIGQGGEGTGPTLVVELPAGSKPKLWESFNAVPSAVSGVSFTIAPSDRVAVGPPVPPSHQTRFTPPPHPLTRAQGKRNVAVTLSFTPKTGIDPGGNIRLVYPSAFFATGFAPQMLASTVPSLQIQGGTTTATSVLLVVAPPLSIAATVPFTVTLTGTPPRVHLLCLVLACGSGCCTLRCVQCHAQRGSMFLCLRLKVHLPTFIAPPAHPPPSPSGFTMGSATDGSNGVTVATSSDPTPSNAVASGTSTPNIITLNPLCSDVRCSHSAAHSLGVRLRQR